MADSLTEEHFRLRERHNWLRWGTYLAERAWGTAREDDTGAFQAWAGFPFEHARARAFRWGDDGLGGFCDGQQTLCMSIALWNERDTCLKERLFGLNNDEGNHGEDIKEYYFYLDGLPTHVYMKALYKYPQAAFPYRALRDENGRRSRDEPEYELFDALRETFEQNRYFDVFIEYAKAAREDILCRVTAINRGPDPAPLHLLPHIWFRNTWAWGEHERPLLRRAGEARVYLEHDALGGRWWHAQAEGAATRLLFTDNDTNQELLFGRPNDSRYTKDGIDEAVVNGRADRVNPAERGTKCAAHAHAVVAPGESFVMRTRFSDSDGDAPFADFDAVFERRIAETDAFYRAVQRPELPEEEREVQRQALGALLWSKQYYTLDVEKWLASRPPPDPDADAGEAEALARDWTHLRANDVLSVPDKWEYPWFAAWDLIFQTVTIALVDPVFARDQIGVLLDDRYQHLDGQPPSFEGGFGHPHPPLHAWGALHVYQAVRQQAGDEAAAFLARIFHRLLMAYSWWFNPRDAEGMSRLKGGFLGMDNISAWDRGAAPPGGGFLDQADSAGWLALNTLTMLEMAVTLAGHDRAYEQVAAHFVDLFGRVAGLLNDPGQDGVGLWDDEDGFYYDVVRRPETGAEHLRVRSYVGLVPLLAVRQLDGRLLQGLPEVKKALQRLEKEKPDLARCWQGDGPGGEIVAVTLAAVPRARLERVLARLVDEDEFLAPFGLRSLSRAHLRHPFLYRAGGETGLVDYVPGEATADLLGGNSNWRGPIWAPISHLFVEALRFHGRHTPDVLVTLPAGAGNRQTLIEAADDLCDRIIGLFRRRCDGERYRVFYGDNPYFQQDPHWRDYLLFYEYFHGEDGTGLGASHQNGWTALIARMIQDRVGI